MSIKWHGRNMDVGPHFRFLSNVSFFSEDNRRHGLFSSIEHSAAAARQNTSGGSPFPGCSQMCRFPEAKWQ